MTSCPYSLTCADSRSGSQHKPLGPPKHEPPGQLQAKATQATSDDVTLMGWAEGLGDGRNQGGLGPWQNGLGLLLPHLQIGSSGSEPVQGPGRRLSR